MFARQLFNQKGMGKVEKPRMNPKLFFLQYRWFPQDYLDGVFGGIYTFFRVFYELFSKLRIVGVQMHPIY